jgi:uncharacterized protein (DUF1501 family)
METDVTLSKPMQRRALLRGALGLGALAPLAGLSLAGSATPGSPRLVLMVLRGGLDGLAAVPAVGDPAFADARGALGRFNQPVLPLDGLLALNPALAGLHARWAAKELVVVHATGLPYRERSHFDAQQVLESGGERPFALDTGWLARALNGGRGKGMAFQSAVPLALRGHAEVDTWAPSTRPDPAPDLVARLARLYADDPALGTALARARSLRGDMPDMVMARDMGQAMAGSTPNAARPAAPVALARQAAGFLVQPAGPQAAVLELGGWDSHANQSNDPGPLSNNLRLLDATLAALHEGLTAPGSGDTWARTVVLVVTEFGRTVAINGTQGTDHGTGGAAFVLGGAVRGGQVITDWPGLAPAQRNEGRDLRITTDLRAVFKTVLAQHLGVPDARLSREVLPGSAGLGLLPLLKG